jgi:1-acyl-sn-glycerol-3-phosphate acyltransferase
VRGSLDRPCRIAATGFCFGVFGLMGLVVLSLIYPAAILIGARSRETQRRVRRILQCSLRWFSKLMVFCGVISFEVRNPERLARRGLLIAANHPSLIDVVLLIALLERPNCVVKASLKANVFTRGPVMSAGFVVNDDGPKLIDDCIASVKAGDNLIVFPEGTRSIAHDGKLSPMKRGLANIALRGNLALTPVVITVTEPMLGKGQPWYRAPLRRPHFVLSVLEDIPMSRYLEGAAREGSDPPSGAFGRLARALTRDLAGFFSREIARRASATWQDADNLVKSKN